MARKTFDIDTLINIFDELSKKPVEMGEQDDAGGDADDVEAFLSLLPLRAHFCTGISGLFS